MQTMIHEQCSRAAKYKKKGSILPDIVSYNSLISGYRIRDLEKSKELVGELRDAVNPLADVVVGVKSDRNIDMLTEDSSFESAGENTHSELQPTFVTYTTLTCAYCKQGEVKEAFSLYEEMVKNGILPDSITYSSLINGLCRSGKVAEAKMLFHGMARMGFVPNHVAYRT
uniref:Pentacotripeptide-repeat region of PRORP domain-containing protein n=1 Tax=Nymphaea colorata TaxID=210225 RepID=A0A5K0YBR8_9MAGN|nr:unnamed protein product [Nymphaea colorata]